MKTAFELNTYKGDVKPTWCPGCGDFAVLRALQTAIHGLQLEPWNVVIVSGIGCSSNLPHFLSTYGFHSIHGRSVPVATGIKLANPDLTVLVMAGDGDLMAIGGNHLIHAARRNVDLTVFCVNNFTYGMTGGQGGPTTQTGARTSTTPYGNIEYPFNLPELVAAAGATYVARWTVLDLGRLRRSMVEALGHKGFAFVEIVSPCPVYYGRRNRLGEAIDELRYYRERTTVQNFAALDELDLALNEEIVVGKFVDEERATYLDLLDEHLIPRVQEALRR